MTECQLAILHWHSFCHTDSNQLHSITLKNVTLMKINDSNFEAVVAEGKPLVLDFWATWCGPCRMIAPIIESLTEEYAGKVNIGKVDVEDEADDLVAQFGIRNVPTVLFIKNGQVVDKLVGAATKPMYEEKIQALLS